MLLELPPQDNTVYEAAAEAANKRNMARMEYPDREYRIVRDSSRDPFEWFSDTDRDWFAATCRAELRNDFGYDYDDWSRPGEVQATKSDAA